jgi:hypothetical protein
MEDALRRELVAKTKQVLHAGDWSSVEQLWQPWIDQGDADAEYELAFHYLCSTPCEDEAVRERMIELLRDAEAKDHPDAIWFLATRQPEPWKTNPDFERLLLRAGHLGSVNAQRMLGVMYATGEWSGPTDLAEARRWYRLAAERGESESQYDLGFMLLLGQGGPKQVDEGLRWVERAGEAGESNAYRLLADCYTNGYCDVPADAAKAALWQNRLDEYDRELPESEPSRHYTLENVVHHSSELDCLWDIEGVTGFTVITPGNVFVVHYDADMITPAELDEKVRAVGLPAVPEISIGTAC